MSTIQTAVTGREDQGDCTQPLQAVAQFYQALNSRDLALMQQNWENSPETVMDNPLGDIKRGWNDIRAVYEALFASQSTYRFECHDYTLHDNGNLFYVVGRERGTLQCGGEPLNLAIRTTRIFRRGNDGRWHQAHHHGSIDDPQMLAAYQSAVLGRK